MASGKIKFEKDDIIFDMPLYTIFMVLGDGWYVLNKNTKIARRFGFERFSSYLEEYIASLSSTNRWFYFSMWVQPSLVHFCSDTQDYLFSNPPIGDGAKVYLQ